MKKLIFLFTVVFFSMAANGIGQQISDFSGWDLIVCPQNQNKCQIQPVGSKDSVSESGSDWSVNMEIEDGKLTFDVDGSEDQGIWTALRKDFEKNASIIIASVKVNDFAGNMCAGFWHSIEAWPKDNQVDEATCVLRVESWDGLRYFPWRVKERSEDQIYEKVLSWGRFGDWDEGWSEGQSYYMGYGMFMDQMFFVVAGYKSVHTFIPLVPFSSNEADFDPALEVYVDQGDDNFINVEFDNVHVQ